MKPRFGNPLIVYTVFIAGSCAAGHALLTTAASNYMSASNAASTKQKVGYSRVEGWMRRQTLANLKKNAQPLQVRFEVTVPAAAPAPEREVAHAVVMAAAIDNAEHTGATPLNVRAIDGKSGVRLVRHGRVRLPACHQLPCQRSLKSALQTATLQSPAELVSKVKVRRAEVQFINKAMPRTARAAGGKKIAAVLTSKRPKATVKNNAAIKLAYQARLKFERKIALRRFRETPAEISYRSFVGTFVPAI